MIVSFIANQMGHKDCPMLVCGRWMDTEFSRELEHIWESMQNIAKITPRSYR